MTLMHMSPQLLCLLIHFRLQLAKRICLDLDDLVEPHDLITILADCHAPFLGKRFEVLDIFLCLFELALEIVLGLLQLFDGFVLLLVLTSESIAFSLLNFELGFEGGDASGEINDLGGFSLETSLGVSKISRRLVKLLLHLGLGSSLVFKLRN